MSADNSEQQRVSTNRRQSFHRSDAYKYYELLWFRYKDNIEVRFPPPFREMLDMYHNYHRNVGRHYSGHVRDDECRNWYWNRRKSKWIYYTRTTKPANHSLSGAIRDRHFNQSMDAKTRIEWNQWKDRMDKRREISEQRIAQRYDRYLDCLSARYQREARERRSRGVPQRRRIKERKQCYNFSDVVEWYWNKRRIDWFSLRRNRGNGGNNGSDRSSRSPQN